MLSKIKALFGKAKAALARVRSTVAVVAGVAAEIVSMGLLHGTALHVVEAVIAAAAVLGVHVATKATVKAAAK